MKISKLFHWLYAILMLLPFLVFLPNAFYYGFNEHAIAQEKTEQRPIYYESNEVTSIDDLVIGNIYNWNNHINSSQLTTNNFIMYIDTTLFEFEFGKTNVQWVRLYTDTTPNAVLEYYDTQNRYSLINNREFAFIPTNFSNKNQCPQIYINAISSSDTLWIKTYETITTDMSITDSMSYAWDSVWHNDLFSWSYGSFLTEPFIYIGNVFNVPNDNSLYYALSYWLDISIIWLCFDLVMYIPLLVHRWLDKGIIE